MRDWKPIKPITPDVAEHYVAEHYVGKTVLVGVTQLDPRGRELGKKSWAGRIARLSPSEGIIIELEDSDDFCALPPDLEFLAPAEPGIYQLSSTGRIVVNPDFTTTWTRREVGRIERALVRLMRRVGLHRRIGTSDA